MDKETYDKLLVENITKTYKKADKNIHNKINEESRIIVKHLGLEDRMECLTKQQSFISLKDHKENFVNSPQCRLINPAKSELGK